MFFVKNNLQKIWLELLLKCKNNAFVKTPLELWLRGFFFPQNKMIYLGN